MSDMKMKRTFLVVTALVLGTFVVRAQEQEEPDFYEIAEKETERLQRTVKLEDWQLFYVDSTLVHDYMEMDAEMKRLQANKVANSAIYQGVQDKWMDQIDRTFRRFFTDGQWELYLKQGAGKAQKARAKREAKRQGASAR